MRKTFWETQVGRVMCSLITKNDHIFSGWNHPKREIVPGAPLPFAYCERCGHEF